MLTLTLTIQEEFMQEIRIEGDARLVDLLVDALKENKAEIPEYYKNDVFNDVMKRKRASFYLPLWNLKKESMMEFLFIFIFPPDKKANMSGRDEFLLKYWAYEIEMIKKKKSYRSERELYWLTSPGTLNNILDHDVNSLFTPESLFYFLENSKRRMKYFSSLGEPPEPSRFEIQKFISALKPKNKKNIKYSIFAKPLGEPILALPSLEEGDERKKGQYNLLPH